MIIEMRGVCDLFFIVVFIYHQQLQFGASAGLRPLLQSARKLGIAILSTLDDTSTYNHILTRYDTVQHAVVASVAGLAHAPQKAAHKSFESLHELSSQTLQLASHLSTFLRF